MKIAIFSATLPEIQPLLERLEVRNNFNNLLIEARLHKTEIDIYVSGIGMTAMAYCCGKNLSSHCDFTINAGIAGSFDRNLSIGEVVNVAEDIFSELGAEDGDSFRTMEEIGLKAEARFKNENAKLKGPTLDTLKKVKGITVNTVHGDETSIAKIITRLNPQVESMEGAAFLYTCNKAGMPCLQIRAISNYVERRNRDGWDIPLAVRNLNERLYELIASPPTLS